MEKTDLFRKPEIGRNMESFSANRKKLCHLLSLLAVMTLALFSVVLLKAYLNGAFNDVPSFQKYIERYGVFAPLLLTMIQAFQVVIPVIPSFFGYAAGTVMFGVSAGFWCNYIGISLGSIIAFFLARRYGTPLLKELFHSEKYQKWSDWAARSRSYSGFLFLATLLPLFPDDYLCYLSGVTEMTARKFIWIILLGKPWCILGYCLGFSFIG